MAQAQTKDKPGPTSDDPTSAQLAKLNTLCEGLEVEVPEVATAAEAQEAIEKLQALYDERSGPGEGDGEPGPDEDEEAAESEGDPAQAKPDDGLSAEQTQKLFDRAVDEFGSALRIVFDVEELQPSQTPGVIGFVLPGFTEKLTHENFVRCTTCNGYGRVLTGSTREGYQEQDCPNARCAGRGYWSKQQAAPVQQVPSLVPMPPAQNGAPSEWETPSWLGDPNIATQPVP